VIRGQAVNFKDHFSGHSAQYSEFRPGYPRDLFSWLASLCEERSRAWDCATGSGQAAISLIEYFDAVIATDASANQIADAIQVNGVSYKVAAAENSGITSDSIDLITVAQALHWFDIPAFQLEADRVLKAGGVLAVWTYGLIKPGPGLDETIAHFYSGIVGEYWPFERKMVESGYSQVQLPFAEISATQLEMTESWGIADLIGYLNTWSAVKAYEKDQGHNPINEVEADLLRQWGDADTKRAVKWPLLVRAWRKPSRTQPC